MKGRRKALFLILLILASLIPYSIVLADPGWLTGWDKRVLIIIDSGDVDEALTDFPILIYISDSSGKNNENISFVFDEVGANSLRIAVTLSDGTTECYVEVDKWDLGNREAWLWSKIASISNITDTEIYLYYDNDHADNNAHVGVTNSVPAENVWDINFKLVWHMRDIDTSSVRDSTSNDNDGMKKGANEPVLIAAGKIDDAQDYDGGNDFISNPAIGNFPDGFTLEISFRTGYIGYRGGLFMQRGNDVANIEQIWVRIETNLNQIRFFYNDGANTPFLVNPDYVDGYWHRAFWAVKPFRSNIWIDEVEEIDDATQDYAGINLDVDGYIGKMKSTTNPGYDFFDGILDEVRISNIDRSEAWGQASYQSEIDDLLDFGDEEERPSLVTPDKLFGAGFNGSTPVVDLYWSTNLTGITLFEVQNSTDKISWTYLGQNTTNEYHDLQVVNGTERYYRVRACNYTGAAWDNSTWTDINFETVYFVMPVGNGDGAALRPEGWVLTIMISAIGGTLIILGTRRRRR